MAILKSVDEAAAKDVDQQLQQIRDDIASIAKTVASYGAAKAENAKAKASQMASDAVDASQGALESVQSQFAALEKDIGKQVRDKPLQALGLAVAAGFILSMLTRR